MVMNLTRAEAKTLTLDFLRDWYSKLPAAQRTAPVIIFDMKSWTVPAMISQVQMDTDVGKRYVNFYVASLKQYVIVR